MPRRPRRFPLLLLALLLLPALSACREEAGGPGTEAPTATPEEGGDAANKDRLEAERAALIAQQIEAALTPSMQCLADHPDEVFLVLRFSGLADLASAEPKTGNAAAEQERVVAILVDATEPTRLPVNRKHDINPHEPFLYFPCHLNQPLCERYGTSSEMGKIPLQGRQIQVGERAPDATVEMQRQAIPANATEPDSLNRCSLNWLPLADDLVTPDHPLQSGVFAASPLSDWVTTHFTVEEGVVFTGTHWVEMDDDTQPCMIDFPDASSGSWPRAMADSFSIAIPADDQRQVTLNASYPGGGTPSQWVFTLGADSDLALVSIQNHPTEHGRNSDFAAHFALRQDMDGAQATVPLPAFDDCTSGYPSGDNPQCSPADNDYP